MNDVERKLQIFEETIMREANQKKLEIETALNVKKQDALEQFELQALEHAYNVIQKEKSSAMRLKNELVSKALAESRRALLSERELMVETIFSNVRQQLAGFKQTQDYKEYLLESAKNAIASAGEGDIAILIDSNDMHHAKWLFEAMGKDVLQDSVKIEGGCRAFNRTKNVIYDNSLASKIAQEKESFLEEVKMSIV